MNKHKSFLKGSLAAVLLVAIVSSGIAAGTHSFTDVPDGAFYTDAVEWAKANGMTTGSPSGSDTFKPLDAVSRGENITFAKRYDDFVVQPALAERLTVDEMAGMYDFATGGFVIVTTDALNEIGGAEVTVTVPEGRTAYVELTFISESLCSGGANAILGPWCEIKFLDGDATVLYGEGDAFDTSDSASVGLFNWASHAAQHVEGPLEPGTHTFTAVASSVGSITPPTFTVGANWSFTAEAHVAS